MTIPMPRLESYPCRAKGCDGFYEPYRDGSLSCYCGSFSGLSVDDVDLPEGIPVLVLEDC